MCVYSSALRRTSQERKKQKKKRRHKSVCNDICPPSLGLLEASFTSLLCACVCGGRGRSKNTSSYGCYQRPLFHDFFFSWGEVSGTSDGHTTATPTIFFVFLFFFTTPSAKTRITWTRAKLSKERDVFFFVIKFWGRCRVSPWRLFLSLREKKKGERERKREIWKTTRDRQRAHSWLYDGANSPT